MVKLKGTRQGIRVLFNEYVSGRLGEFLQVPLGQVALVDVPDSLQPVDDRRVLARIPGLHFGTRRFPDAQTDIQQLAEAGNFEDFCGVVVFDTFIGRRNSRQFAVYPSSGWPGGLRDRGAIFDQGFAFTGEPNWTVESLNSNADCTAIDDLGMKNSFRAIDAYEPWLRRLDALTRRDIEGLIREAPIDEWQVTEGEAVALAEWLDRRRTLVRQVLQDHLR